MVSYLLTSLFTPFNKITSITYNEYSLFNLIIIKYKILLCIDDFSKHTYVYGLLFVRASFQCVHSVWVIVIRLMNVRYFANALYFVNISSSCIKCYYVCYTVQVPYVIILSLNILFLYSIIPLTSICILFFESKLYGRNQYSIMRKCIHFYLSKYVRELQIVGNIFKQNNGAPSPSVLCLKLPYIICALVVRLTTRVVINLFYTTALFSLFYTAMSLVVTSIKCNKFERSDMYTTWRLCELFVYDYLVRIQRYVKAISYRVSIVYNICNMRGNSFRYGFK